MKNRSLYLALVFAAGARAIGAADGQSLSVPSVPSTASSEQYSEVTCTGTNPAVNADILQMAGDTRDEIGPVLRLGPKWRFPVHIIVIMPDDPLADRIHEERVLATASGKTLTLEAALPFSDPDLKSFVQRQFVTALLWEKFFARTQSFDTHTDLGVVPVWLIEGLSAWIDDDSGRDREGIVRRAAMIHRTPTLNEITGWQDISQDRLLGLYQKAFCFYLVNSLIHGERERANFQRWLDTFAGDNPGPAAALFPTEATWQQLLLDAPARSHDIIYTWDESAAALTDAKALTIPGDKPEDAKTGSVDDITDYPHTDKLTGVLQQKIFELTALELRAHPSWRPIFALYRFGLTSLMNNHQQQAETYIHEAQHRCALEQDYHQKLTDYVNWFEVTKDYAGHTSRFNLYFLTARSMEQMQANPDRPNPLRADLIHVESQL